jgi:hypothetical protein
MTTRLLLLAAVVVGLTAGCGSEAAPENAEPREATSERTGSAGVTVELPSGWYTTTWSDGSIVDPLTRVVVASAPIRPKETACQVAQYDFAADAVALVVLEWQEPLRTLPERPGRFTNRELPVQPPPAIECFDGSGGSAQFIDQGRAFGAYLLVGPQAPDQLIDDARSVLDTLQVESRQRNASPQRLVRNGISVAVPAGWDGRILFREATGRNGVLLQVANFALPDNEGLEPPRELPPGQEDPIKAMDEGDVLVMISEPASWDGAETSAAAPKPPTVAELTPVPVRRVPRGHSLSGGSFCTGGRCVDIQVDFGAVQPGEDLVRRVNEVLGSLALGG